MKNCSAVAAFLLLVSLTPLIAEEAMQAPQTKRPNIKIAVSRETTWLTEPLRADGTVDYLAALNRRASQGVTPENNAVVAFWRAVGPKDIDQKVRKQYFALLGIAELPEEGDYLVPLDTFAPPLPEDAPEEKQPWHLLQKCCEKPWTKQDYPLIADLLEKNTKHLDAIVEGVKRPRAYWPLVAKDDGTLAKHELNIGLSEVRNVARHLAARSMLRLGEGDLPGAWQDILALERLGRHICAVPLLVEQLIGVYITVTANQRALFLSQSSKLDADAARQSRKQLLDLPPIQPLREIISEGERIFVLDMICDISANKEQAETLKVPDILYSMYDDKTKKVHQALLKLVADNNVDCNESLRLENDDFNQLLQAMRHTNYLERLAAVERLEVDKDEVVKKAVETVADLQNLNQMNPKHKARLFLDLLHGRSPFGVTWKNIISIEPRHQSYTDLSLLAFSLEAFRREKGQYPKTLDQLVPDYADAIPADRFLDGKQALKYSADKDGYLLYSVGANGRDDGGRNFNMDHGNYTAAEYVAATEEEKARDDIAIRSPAAIQ